MLTELVIHNPVVFIDQPLLGRYKAPADRAAHLVPKLTKKGSGQNVNYESGMVIWAVREWQHAYIQDLDFR